MKSVITAVVGCALGITFMYGLTKTFESYVSQKTKVFSSDLLAFKGVVEENNTLNNTILLQVARNNFQQNPTKVRVAYNSDTTWSRTSALVQDGYFFGVQDSKPIQPTDLSSGDQIYIIRDSSNDTQIRATYITILDTTL
ncbi:MAG: hypothetical protein JKX80_01000 [Candidatus Pacebacteria bacterium]|nr:hypothetical protein [Candidatus Paceibacterota bacterium]